MGEIEEIIASISMRTAGEMTVASEFLGGSASRRQRIRQTKAKMSLAPSMAEIVAERRKNRKVVI